MNKMKEIAELYGLELGECFKIKGRDDRIYKFTEQGLVDRDGKCARDTYLFDLDFVNIATGEYEIEHLSWKPKAGNGYWFISFTGIANRVFDDNNAFDLMNYKYGNCFKSMKQAGANKDKILAMRDEIRKELEE